MPFKTQPKRLRLTHRSLPPQRRAVIAILSILLISQSGFADDRERRIQTWLHRTTNTVDAIMADLAVESHRKNLFMLLAAGALGAHGYIAEFHGICERAALGADSSLRQEGLMSLVDGLASKNHMEDAFAMAASMLNDRRKTTAYSMIPIRQAQSGNFEKAELLLKRVPDARAKDRAIAQICREYAKLRQFHEATRLCASIADNESRSRVMEEIEEERKQPAVDDPAYVDFRLNEARNHWLIFASESRLRFLSHLYKAEVALSRDNREVFLKESEEAKRRLKLGDGNDGYLLFLAKLLHQAGQKDEARLLYLRLFENYKQEEDDDDFDFNKMLFGAGKPSNAEIVVECLPDEELKLVINELAKVKSARNVVSAMLGVVVSRRNPDWAEDVYEAVSDIGFKAELASYCLMQLAAP